MAFYLEGWRATPMRDFSHVEIIDIAGDEALRSRWAEYIAYQHDIVAKEFWDSCIARWPRRTAEWKVSASLYGIPTEHLARSLSYGLVERASGLA
jgi:hypothetical protein